MAEEQCGVEVKFVCKRLPQVHQINLKVKCNEPPTIDIRRRSTDTTHPPHRLYRLC